MQLKELASKLINLWNLMDSPPEERNLFDNVTCNISASIDEVITPGALALGLIKQVLKDHLKFKGSGSKSYAN
jgi:protein regulator of cytokinesis 1